MAGAVHPGQDEVKLETLADHAEVRKMAGAGARNDKRSQCRAGGKAWADAACHQRSTDMKYKRHGFSRKITRRYQEDYGFI